MKTELTQLRVPPQRAPSWRDDHPGARYRICAVAKRPCRNTQEKNANPVTKRGQLMNPSLEPNMLDVLNVDELLARCMGNAGIAERILTKFQERFSIDLGELENGLSNQDAEAVTLVAHRIKGASANVSAPYLFELASQIEQLGRARRISEISPGVEQLRHEWTRFRQGISGLELNQWMS